eukprot:835420-Pleurochrysis_carterae.AAC.4
MPHSRWDRNFGHANGTRPQKVITVLKTASQCAFVMHFYHPHERRMIDVKHAWPSPLRLRRPCVANWDDAFPIA